MDNFLVNLLLQLLKWEVVTGEVIDDVIEGDDYFMEFLSYTVEREQCWRNNFRS